MAAEQAAPPPYPQPQMMTPPGPQPQMMAPPGPYPQMAQTGPYPQMPPPPFVQGPASGPYRIPDPPGLVPFDPRFRPPKQPRTVLGPAIALFGVMLWSFVVAGQYTTSWMTGTPLNQGVAAGFVFAASLVSLMAGVRQSRLAVAPRSGGHLFGRAIGIFTLGFLLFVLAVFFAMVAGSASSRNHDFGIAFTLVVLATVAAIWGPRLTSPVRLEQTHRMRAAVILMWIAGALLTLVAGIDLAANG